jgi:hypothetical protein
MRSAALNGLVPGGVPHPQPLTHPATDPGSHGNQGLSLVTAEKTGQAEEGIMATAQDSFPSKNLAWGSGPV